MQNSTVVFQLNISNKTSFCASISRPNEKPRNVSGNFAEPTATDKKTQMKKTILKHTIIRFLFLVIPYSIWFAMYAEAGYKRQTYDLDKLPLYLFFFFSGLIFIEIFRHIYDKNKPKYLSNILLLIFFILLYFILPHRTNFN